MLGLSVLLAGLSPDAQAQAAPKTPSVNARPAVPRTADYIVAVVNSEPVTNHEVQVRRERIEAQLAELFTPFNRLGRDQAGNATGPGTQGTGIGLVICRKLSELMGGELAVASQPGAGSVFTLSLPRPVGEPMRTDVSASMPLMPQVSIGTVLYIEGNPADIAAMREIVQARPGVTLVSARTAAQGLAVAADADLVLLDLDLPDRPGINVLRAMQADTRLRATPVIVVSAESRPQRIDECFDAGASQFLTKPLDAQQTLRAIDDSLDGG